jgi:hypothetical protein
VITQEPVKKLNIDSLINSRDYVWINSTSSTDYFDDDVINDTEYCYYTTAENEAGESGASNIVCATPEGSGPAADVLLGIGDLIIDLGETGDLDLTMENEDPVAGFQFELTFSEETEIVNILTTDRTEGFNVSWGNNIIVGFSLSGDVIEPGSGAYVVVEFAGIEGGSAEICYQDVILSDPNAEAMPYNTSFSCASLSYRHYNRIHWIFRNSH